VKSFWDILSMEERKIFEDAATETRDFQRKVAREMSDKSREFLIRRGMQINDIAPEEMPRMGE
jgi:TRAP-type C4-dicarboxylate transport system substrate-binding protein